MSTLSSGETISTYSTIYSLIPCRYYNNATVNGKLKRTDLARDTKLNDTNIILQPDKTNVEIGDRVTIECSNMGSIWQFVVDDVKAQKGIMPSVDHVYITCTRING